VTRESRRFILASASPRRRLLLESAGFDPIVIPPPVDDSLLKRGCISACAWVMALAYFKARVTHRMILDGAADASPDNLILAADTVCVHGDRLLGKPHSGADARNMIFTLRNAVHETITGVCMLQREERRLFFDAARVTIGDLSNEQIERYIDSGEWAGKAGAYNLSERIDAGWPIVCEGDHATVMGLPMNRLRPMLTRE